MKFNRKHVEKLRGERFLLFHLGKFKWRGVVYDGKHPTYVPREWLLAIMERKGKKINTKYGLGTYGHLFRCAYCNSSIIWVPKKKTLKSGEVKIYNLYWCADSRKEHRANKVKVHSVNEYKIDDAFEKVLEKIQITKSLSVEVANLLKVRFDNFSDNQATKVNGLKGKVKELERRENKLYDDLCDGVVSRDIYKRQCERIQNERVRLEEELSFYGYEVSSKELYTDALEILELANSLKSLWKVMLPHEKRSLIKTVCLNQRVNASSVEFNLKKPFQKKIRVKLKDGAEEGT